MENYLGETIVEQKDSPFKDYDTVAWAMYYLERYGGIDGGHHKAWVLDQMARIIKGTLVIISLAKWKNGHKEYHVSTGEPSKEYLDWVVCMRGPPDEDGEDSYEYDEGIAP